MPLTRTSGKTATYGIIDRPPARRRRLLSFFSANDPEPKEEGKAKGQRGGREREWLLKPQG